MFTRLTKSTLIAALVVAGLGAAHAEGPYAGGGLDTLDCRSGIYGVGSRLYASYPTTTNLAVEGGAPCLGNIDDAAGNVTLRGVFDAPVGRYEFAPRWSVLGIGGVESGRLATTSGDDSSRTLELGTGLQYDLNKQVSLRADYEHYHFSDPLEGKPRLGEFSLGLKFGF